MRSQIKLFFISGLILLFLLAAQTMALAGAVVPVIFSDVNKGEPNWLFINYLTNRGLVKGYADGKFRPEANLTRAEAVTLLMRASGISSKAAQTPFKDVKNNHWAAGNIIAALKAGLIKGYPDGTFRPNALLTRAEGIALLLRISKQPVFNISLPVLKDLSSQHWAAGPISLGIAAEMVSLSKDNQHFLPNIPMTRREMARALAVLLTKDPELAQAPLNNQAKVLQGTVQINRAGTSFEVTDQFEVLAGDTIKTAANSKVEVAFTDGTGLQIKENTELTIKETKGRAYIKADGTKGTAVEWLALELKQGKIFGALATPEATTPAETAAFLKDQRLTILKSITAVENKPGLFTTLANKPALPWWKYHKTKRVKVKVDMPWGVAAIRGTFWENAVSSDGRSKTTLLIGEGELTSGGQTVLLKANERTEITSPNAAPIPPAPMTNEEKKEWVEAKVWVVERAQDIQVNQEKILPPAPPAVAQSSTAPGPIAPVEEVLAPVTMPSLTDIVGDINKAIGDAEKSISQPSSGGSSSVAVSEVTLNQSNITLIGSGDTYTLAATVLPTNATNKNVTWSSDNTAVATVTNGEVTSVGAGSAIITVTTASGGKTASCTVTVSHVDAAGVTLNRDMMYMTAGGDAGALTALVAPENATNKSVYWESINPDIATVNSSGVVTPVSQGIAQIRVSTAGDTYEDLCSVNVSAPVTFSTPVIYSVGTSPQNIAQGDFNGDWQNDLVVVNNTYAAVLLNNGDGTYQTAINIGAGSNPRSVAVGDINNDGQEDLVIANYGSDNISLLLGIGNGTFETPLNYNVGTKPINVICQDFNNDNFADVAIVNEGSNNVSVLITGQLSGGWTGNFQSPVLYAVTSPSSLAAEYLNDDLYLDIVAVNNGSGNISVLLNNGWGNGGFEEPVNYSVGTNPTMVAIEDFNHDGTKDLAVANSGSNNISILMGIPSGGYMSPSTGTFEQAVNFNTGGSAISIVAGKFNGDMMTDLAVVKPGSNALSILASNGDGTFQSFRNYTVGPSPSSLLTIGNSTFANLAVVNQDDLAAGTVSILVNNTP